MADERPTLEPLPEDFARALVIVAHPDDLEYGAASAVARWTSLGKEVSYVLATSGEAGIDGISPSEAGPLREDEERRSAAVVGVTDVAFLGYPDGLLEYGVPLRRDLAASIRRVRPEVVVVTNFGLTWGPGGYVNHIDHRVIGLAAVDACRDAANRWLFTDAGEPWSGLKGFYVFASGPPTHYVDVTETLEAGIQSLAEHRAYIEGLGGDFDPDAFLRGSARSAGEKAGCEYAVLFRKMHV